MPNRRESSRIINNLMYCFSDIRRYQVFHYSATNYTLYIVFVVQRYNLYQVFHYSATTYIISGISLLSYNLYIVHWFSCTKIQLVFKIRNGEHANWDNLQKKCRRACIIQRIVVPLHPLLRNRATERSCFLQVGLFLFLNGYCLRRKRVASVLPRNERDCYYTPKSGKDASVRSYEYLISAKGLWWF